MGTSAEDRRIVPGAGTPIVIPASTPVDLTTLFADPSFGGGQAYARRIVNPSASAIITVTAVRLLDAKIGGAGATTGCTMALQPGEPWDGEFISLHTSSSAGSIVNVEQ